ncbi:MAG: hypothetical protein ACFFBC_13795 [Promethearchaeota archaeon]
MRKIPFCKDCGAEIKDPEHQNYCEKCGSAISSPQGQMEVTSIPSTSSSITTLGFEPYDRSGGLFDINRNYYILKEKS